MFVRKQQHINNMCNQNIFGDLILVQQNIQTSHDTSPVVNVMIPFKVTTKEFKSTKEDGVSEEERQKASRLIDELLLNIYNRDNCSILSGYTSTTSIISQTSFIRRASFELEKKDEAELSTMMRELENHVARIGSVLVRKLKRRDALRRQRDSRCDVITGYLRKQTPEAIKMRFSLDPTPDDSGFDQWHSGMRMVAQLPGGIPPEFRRKLWSNLADKHLTRCNVNWPKVERDCFSEWSHPADAELGVQIVKDLHRTGCSLFCGEDGQQNQALLKRVLLAYARWNKAVGYCQGFNMLAALILQVTDKCEKEALKMMIFLIEGVLPESYFADSLRGLSVDMAAFRELLKTRLPKLSRHLDTLQTAAKEGTTSYEPPLTNVFTMQWFLTLFCNCLPQPTVLRVWDLILLEGNEVLLRTALAIWQAVDERILEVRSADEFYCIMGVLTREILEFGIVDPNALIKSIVTIGPLTELPQLREKYLYNINPWGSNITTNKVEEEMRNRQLKVYGRERLTLDISALKKQYAKLKHRQRQAHIIFSAAVARQPSSSAPVVAMNHLLLGKCALVPARRIGPPKGSIPPPRHIPPTTLHWKDALPRQSSSSSSSSSDTELCDDPDEPEETNSPINGDNLFKANGDNLNLMNLDNTSDVINVVNELPPSDAKSEIDLDESSTLDNNKLILENSDIFDTAESTKDSGEVFDFGKFNLQSDSEDEGFDFEKFLENRVQCLKESSIEEEEDSGACSSEYLEYKKIGSTRKNSQRALEIIQENSLILHRILQCQTRLTPSPPLTEIPTGTKSFVDSIVNSDNENQIVSDISTSSHFPYSHAFGENNTEKIESPTLQTCDDNLTSLLKFDYRNCEEDLPIPYDNNFENSFCGAIDIQNENPISELDLTSSGFIDENYTEEEAVSANQLNYDSLNITYERENLQISNREEDEVEREDVQSSFNSILDADYGRDLDKKYESLILKSNNKPTYLDLDDVASTIDDNTLVHKFNSVSNTSPTEAKFEDKLTSLDGNNRKKSIGEELSFLKSPTSGRIYNPFPINISSRQNKDVGFRLGLYKKS